MTRRDPILDGPCPVCDRHETSAAAIAVHNIRCGTPAHGERSYQGRPAPRRHLAPDGLTPAQWLAREYPT